MAHPALYRGLSIGHYLIAVPLIALSTLFGLILAPVLAAGPVWLCVLGTQLWQGPSPRLCTWVRITHLISLFVSALLIVMGVFALSAAQRSAAQGGGLLGAWGFVPMIAGGLLALLAVATLVLVGPEPVTRSAQ
jgi:hypothetical protein